MSNPTPPSTPHHNPRTSQDVENEINKMKMLQLDPHDNIVRFWFKITNCEAYIVMEYCDGGSLRIIHDKPDKSKKQPPLPASLVLRWMTECAEGLSICTVKTSSIGHQAGKCIDIWRQRGVAKLGDFGLAKGCQPVRRCVHDTRPQVPSERLSISLPN